MSVRLVEIEKVRELLREGKFEEAKAFTNTLKDLPELIQGQMLSPKAASKLLNDNNWPIAERTLRRWCETEEIAGAKKVGGPGGSWFIPESSIRAIFDEPDSINRTINAARS